MGLDPFYPWGSRETGLHGSVFESQVYFQARRPLGLESGAGKGAAATAAEKPKRFEVWSDSPCLGAASKRRRGSAQGQPSVGREDGGNKKEPAETGPEEGWIPRPVRGRRVGDAERKHRRGPDAIRY